jgi:type VI secretion system protein ImpL
LLETILGVFYRVSSYVTPLFSWLTGTLAEISLLAWVFLFVGILLIVGTFYLVKFAIKKEKLLIEPPATLKKTISVYTLPPIGGWISEFLSRKGFFKIGRLSIDFLNSLSFLSRILKCSDYKYKNPWILVLGAESSGKTTLMKTINSIEADWQKKEGKKLSSECNWFFLRNGVALDISGKLFVEKETVKADEIGWNALKNLLVRYRSAKPIDSILLTLSAEDLYGKNRMSSSQCLDRAKFMAQKLSTFQDQIGLRIPVYIVITKTDIIPGFRDLCANIPINTQQNIFGWTSPYVTEIAFSEQVVKEAIDFIAQQIHSINMDISCENLSTEFNDNLFVFPHELTKIHDNLSLYINQLFKVEPYKTPLLLRGIYLCGNSDCTLTDSTSTDFIDESLLKLHKIHENGDKKEDVTTTNETQLAVVELEQCKRIFFFGDLIFSKIIPEYALCIPQKNKFFTANKNIKIAKISTVSSAIICSFGMYNAYKTFTKSRELIAPAVNSMYRFLVRTQQIPILELAKKNADFDTSVRQLTSVMQKLSKADFFSIFIPASWFSPLQSKLNESVNLAYQNVIVRALYINLLLKARSLLHLSPTNITPTTSLAQLAIPTKSNEFIAMKDFVLELAKLSDYVNKFNDLRVVPSAKVLAELVDYAFKITLPASFLKHYGQMKGKLNTATFPSIDITVYKSLARNTFASLFQHFFNTIFIFSNPMSFPGQLEQIIRQLRHIDSHSLPNLNYLRNLSADLSIVLKIFEPENTAKPDASETTIVEETSTWMDKDVFEPHSDFENFLCALDKSPFFGAEISQAVVDNCAVGMFHLKNSLNQITTLLTTDIRFGPQPGNASKMCSHGLLLLGKALKTLFNEPYMRVAIGHQFIDRVPDGQVLYWDDKLLNAACELCTQYEEFSTKKIGAFPVVLQESFRLLARDGLQQNVISLIAQAQNFVSIPVGSNNGVATEEMIRSLTANIRTVYTPFLKLLKLLNYESVSFFYITLRDVLLYTNYWILDQINMLMKKIGPYHIWDPSFSWWNGKTSPAYPAYGVKDSQDLNSFLDIQSQHLINLAITLAKPVVDFLTSDIMLTVNPLNRTLLTKWKRIVEQTEAFQNKQPGNSIAILETFVTTTFKGYTLENVFEEIKLSDIQEDVGDHFLETVQFMKKGVLGRVEVLTRQKNIKNYQILMHHFNKNLRGKFPFTPPATDVAQNAEVDPEDLKEFLLKFKEFGGSAEIILDQIYQLGFVAREAVVFLKKVEDIFSLFDDYLTNNSSGIPSITYTNEFNVNRERAAGENYVAEWTIKTNYEASVSNADTSKHTSWVYGCPAEVSFRWPNVKGLTELPLNDPKQKSLKVLETTATFVYKGNWSFFRMIRHHKASRGEYLPMANPDSVILKFVIPVSDKKSAVLFNTVSFLKDSTNQKLQGRLIRFPDFPTLAPDFPQEIEQYRNEPVLSFGVVKPTAFTTF